MRTIQESLLPSAMVPGLVTIEDKDGNRQNVYPIDAKELLRQGDYTLVENGAIEAARMAATPLRSGMASGIPSENIIAEVAGIEGRVIASADPKVAAAVRDASDAQADALPNDGTGEVSGASATREAAASMTGGTAGTEGTFGKTPEAAPAETKAAAKTDAKADDKK